MRRWNKEAPGPLAAEARSRPLPVIIGAPGGLDVPLSDPRPRRLACIGAVAARVTPQELARLRASPAVAGLWPDRLVAAANVPHGAVRPVHLSPGAGGGEGITVAMLDSGVDPHPAVADRLRAFHDLVAGRDEPYDDYGHGTHLAGIICARPGAAKAPGLAPAASILAIKVLNREGVGRESTIIEGIDRVLAEHRTSPVAVLNVSLGGLAEGSWVTDPLCRAVCVAWEAGIVVVATAGNEGGRGPATIRTPGTCPACITVGALGPGGRVAPFSSRGPSPDGLVKPDLVAPGVGIVSLRVQGSFLDELYPHHRLDTGGFAQTGSSVATAVVSAAVAVFLSRHRGARPGEVKLRLHETASALDERPWVQGFGRLNLGAFLGGRGEGCAPSPQLAALQSRLHLLGYRRSSPATGVNDPELRSALERYRADRQSTARGPFTPAEGACIARLMPLGGRALSAGRVGMDVAQLQRLLAPWGGAGRDPTGEFGPDTAAAVEAYARASGLAPRPVADARLFWRLGFDLPGP